MYVVEKKKNYTMEDFDHPYYGCNSVFSAENIEIKNIYNQTVEQ